MSIEWEAMYSFHLSAQNPSLANWNKIIFIHILVFYVEITSSVVGGILCN